MQIITYLSVFATSQHYCSYMSAVIKDAELSDFKYVITLFAHEEQETQIKISMRKRTCLKYLPKVTKSQKVSDFVGIMYHMDYYIHIIRIITD